MKQKHSINNIKGTMTKYIQHANRVYGTTLHTFIYIIFHILTFFSVQLIVFQHFAHDNLTQFIFLLFCGML